MFIMDAHCDTLMDVVEGRRRLADEDKGASLTWLEWWRVESPLRYSQSMFLPSICLEPGPGRALQYVDAFYREIEENSDRLVFATSGTDVEEAYEEGKIAALLSIEGARRSTVESSFCASSTGSA